MNQNLKFFQSGPQDSSESDQQLCPFWKVPTYFNVAQPILIKTASFDLTYLLENYFQIFFKQVKFKTNPRFNFLIIYNHLINIS